ncbi:hypothetical protein GCM10010435_32600 [Winogradskya consettensis]|uniref:HTH tetR-type domain-containing protein n=1 Tax=Winogradskya consettensis TaxID=113560 RepID=A0A919SEC4_9ACTN|nr:TetR/AcrR family transcriptional regulator [Actinoplanes consettensis]GIM70174.1 hypothetical protein Aco04nite_18890 [Actinoplanes consettensis]
MPRLTEARRDMRRDQIADAAMRCFARNGLDRTSIADIVAESGLSAGSIYAHYRNKADLVTAVTGQVLDRKSTVLQEWAAQDPPPHPDELPARLVALMSPEKARVAVQTWAAATVDPGVRAVLAAMFDGLCALLQDYATTWLIKTQDTTRTAAQERAVHMVGPLVAQFQSEILSRALDLRVSPQ